MKLNRLIVLLVVLAMVSVAAVAQETGGKAFLLELSTQLAELGWDDDALAEFEAAAGELDWSGAENADPRLVAWAFEFGMPDDALAVQERANLALALATQTAKLTRLGYAERDVAEAAMQATRAVVGGMAQLRNETGNPDLGEMIQNRLNEAMEEQARTATRTRGGNASGGTYRIGESDPGIPLNPDDPPRPGDPAGPGDNSPDGTGDQSGPNN